jgi:hypothetical protein
MILRSICSIGSWILSTGSWMFSAGTNPDACLLYHRHLRDFGTIMVLTGVVSEILIDEFWEVFHPPLLRGTKATTLLKSKSARRKRYAMIFAGIVLVGGGISMELWQGTKADDVADQIRVNLQEQVVVLNIRNQALTLMASGRAAQMLRTPKLAALARFKGTKALITDASTTPMLGQFGRLLNAIQFDRESWGLAGKILGDLGQLGWKMNVCLACPPPILDVTVFSKRLPKEVQQQPFFAPKLPPLPRASPDERAYIAADALVSYLNSVSIRATHLTRDRLGNFPIEQGEVVILVGKREQPIDLDALNNLEQALAQQLSAR